MLRRVIKVYNVLIAKNVLSSSLQRKLHHNIVDGSHFTLRVAPPPRLRCNAAAVQLQLRRATVQVQHVFAVSSPQTRGLVNI